MEPFFTWSYFVKGLIFLIGFYWVFALLGRTVELFSKKNNLARLFLVFFEKVSIYYKSIATVLLIIIFVGINPVLHGIFFLMLVILGYSHIRHYVNGVLFKANPLIGIGANIKVGSHEGRIESFLPFGVILHTTQGERFLHYNDIEKEGFSVTHKEDGTLRQTIFIPSDTNAEKVLDLLFDNPLVNYRKKPVVIALSDRPYQKLQLTLEKGVRLEDIIAFLEQNDISTTLTNNSTTNGNI